MITLFAGCGSTKTEPSSSAGGQSTETASAAGSGTAEAGTEPGSSLLDSLPEAVGAGVEIAASPEIYAATDLSRKAGNKGRSPVPENACFLYCMLYKGRGTGTLNGVLF